MTKRIYVIQWKSMVNGRAGKGTKTFEREEAQQLVQELNREYPQIHHELVEAVPPSEMISKRSEPEWEAPVEELELAGVR